LSGWTADGLTDQMMGELPRSLTELQSLRGMITKQGLVQCPPNLHHLTVDVSPTSEDILSFYPPKSTVVRLVDGPCAAQLRGPMLPFLRTLELTWITDQLCELMPRDLMTYVEFNGGILSPKGAAAIPKTIHSLYAVIEIFTDDECFEHLGFLDRITLKSRVRDGRDQPLCLTPHFLKRIKLAAKSSWKSLTLQFVNGDVSEKLLTHDFWDSLSALKNLKSLQLDVKKFKLEPTFFQQLPHTITDLVCGKLSCCPTSSHFDLLPPKLLKLDISWSKRTVCDWEDEIFAHLPKNLHTLRTSAKSKTLTREGITANAPHALFEYRARWSDVLAFRDPITRIYGAPEDEEPEDDFGMEDFYETRHDVDSDTIAADPEVADEDNLFG